MSPEAVQLRIAELAREQANRSGGLAAVHAVDGFRTAYLALWNRFQNETHASSDSDFFPDSAR
jgi:hypothetical protein